MQFKPKFDDVNEKISTDEFFSLLAYLDKTLAVGVEMERPISYGRSIATALKAPEGKQRDLSYFKRSPLNPYNIAYIYPDGSVHNNEGDGGAEIVFAGTTDTFHQIRAKLHAIEEKLDELGCDQFDESCSNHITLVTTSDKIVPDAVLKNLFQLSRAFCSGLLLFGGATSTTVVRPRMGMFAATQIVKSPLGEPALQLLTTPKYSFCNMSKQAYYSVGGRSAMAGICVEFRAADGHRVPSALAALMVLYKSIAHKAVELSLNGVVNADSIHDWDANKRACSAIIGGPAGQRAVGVEMAQDNARALLEFIAPQLKAYGEEPTQILRKLIDEPLYIRQIGHRNKWKLIERDLSGRNHDNALSPNEVGLVDIVIAGNLRATSAKLYRDAVAQQMNLSVRMVEYLMQKIREKTGKDLIFDEEMQRYTIR